MNIAIPNPQKRRALVVVDAQSEFVNLNDGKTIFGIANLIKQGEYIILVSTVFSSKNNLLWQRQVGWKSKRRARLLTNLNNLFSKYKNSCIIEKSTKSAWKGSVDLIKLFKKNKIEEVHVVGFDADDCVIATAQESFDLGFQTYVLEEAIGSSQGDIAKKEAINILRRLEMTNHSRYINEFGII